VIKSVQYVHDTFEEKKSFKIFQKKITEKKLCNWFSLLNNEKIDFIEANLFVIVLDVLLIVTLTEKVTINFSS